MIDSVDMSAAADVTLDGEVDIIKCSTIHSAMLVDGVVAMQKLHPCCFIDEILSLPLSPP